MRSSDPQDRPSAWVWLLALGCGVIVICAVFPAKKPPPRPARTNSPANPMGSTARADWLDRRAEPFRKRFAARAPAAAEIVAAKLAQFAESRRDLAHALARRHQVQMSPEVERFFDAVQAGDWDRIEAAFKVINGGDSSAGHADNRPPDAQAVWPAIVDAYGAAEQVHLWPAQKLLDYGNAILGALSPGMVYVGGTDNGRWIPELLNDTSDRERHLVVTQNGLADASYVDYLNLQYDGRLVNLTEEDSHSAFQQYIEDAQRRLQHDQQFPDEPKQVLPNEDIQISDGKVQVSGQVAVMSINERLLQMLMSKNPDLSFAIQESFPFKSTYATAAPLGPLMELRVTDGADAFSADQAQQSVAYWQTTAQQVLQDPEAAGSPAALKSWSHDINSTANLLAAHGYTDEAEQTYQLSSQLWPGNPEPVVALAGLLQSSGQADQARNLLENFGRQYPDQRNWLEAAGVWKLVIGK